MSEKKKRVIFGCLVGISFIAILIYNGLTPLMSDDLLFDKSLYQSAGDIFRQEYEQYLNWNGRSVLQIILKIFSILPKEVFNVCNSICFVYTSLLIYWNINERKKYDFQLYILIQLFLWNFSVDFDQTVLWLGGACNYLWGAMIILSFITLFRYMLKIQSDKGKVPCWMVAVLLVSAFLAGWGNENTSGGAILIVALFTGIYFMEKKRVEKWMAGGLTAALLGFGFLLFAPGNRVRGSIVKEGEAYEGLAALVSRGLKIFKAVDEYLLIYMVLICFLGAYFYYEKKKAKEFRETAIFVFAGLATAAVLVFTPEPMARAYYGANIYMLIGALLMLQKLTRADKPWYALKTGGILAGSLVFLFIYIEEGANLARILREVNEREAYIEAQVALGNRELALPMLRPQFESPYSFMYESDLALEGDLWMNEVYRICYDLDSITVMTRDDWEAYTGAAE
ncbi:MAG: DUF6056 family protein [Lachnospiraceae bacterium]|nr:DUF6056 family protein [Lachnospiraceae bacterium]